MTTPHLPHWPYPFWIAHRGGGSHAPENTLAAFRAGVRAGWRMSECDVKLSREGVLYLLHDDTLDRTTDGHGDASALPWSALSQLDAAPGWPAARRADYAGEPLPALASVARFCRANAQRINLEIKPSPGADEATGRAVAQFARQHWRGVSPPPLLSSFSRSALASARAAAPELPVGLLLEEVPDDWRECAAGLGCAAIVAEHTLCTAEFIGEIHRAGMRALCYTVDDAERAATLRARGIDGIVTDRLGAGRDSPDDPGDQRRRRGAPGRS